MKPKALGKIGIDFGMTVLLMLLMAFERVGRAAHEWIGIGIFLLFILHHILNRNWSKNLFRGNYSPIRILQTVSAALVLVTMLGSMVSAVLISRQVFAFLPISGGRAFGRSLHMLCAYWGFVLLSLHLGLHWNQMMGMAGRLCRHPSRPRRLLLRILGACIALYGIYAFCSRGVPGYMSLQNQFVFFDFDEPLVFLLLDHLAILGLFVWLGHYLARAAGYFHRKRANGK